MKNLTAAILIILFVLITFLNIEKDNSHEVLKVLSATEFYIDNNNNKTAEVNELVILNLETEPDELGVIQLTQLNYLGKKFAKSVLLNKKVKIQRKLNEDTKIILPDGKDYTFWGKGVSQGHSDAIRRVEGVKDGKQYTIPVEAALEAVRNGEDPELTTRQKHTRECFVVLEEGADAKKVEEEIKTMPNYFSDYDTTVHFISQEELDRDHSKIPHGGFVLRSGCTGWEKENKHIIEYSLKLDSNPEFTSSVLVAYARAAYKLSKEGQSGCKTVFDIAPAYLSAKSGDELRASLL